MISKEEFIARLRHLGWCCYQIAANQEYNTIPNEDQYNSLLQGTRFGLKNIGMTPEENHDNWMKCKTEQGWVYGEVKDFDKKTHPDLVPFAELSKVEADKDIMDCMMVKELSNFYDEYINVKSSMEVIVDKLNAVGMVNCCTSEDIITAMKIKESEEK